MSKFAVEIAELVKKQYVVDCYTADEALELIEEQAPRSVEVVTESVWNIEGINEYEYDKFYKDSQISIQWTSPTVEEITS